MPRESGQSRHPPWAPTALWPPILTGLGESPHTMCSPSWAKSVSREGYRDQWPQGLVCGLASSRQEGIWPFLFSAPCPEFTWLRIWPPCCVNQSQLA